MNPIHTIARYLFKTHLNIILPSTTKKTPGLYYASELYRPSDHRLSVKLVPILADRGCRVVSAKNTIGR
jgi:hypothetical protein